VKRVRQMRVLADGGKRRAPLTGAAALPPKTAAALLAKQSSGSFSSDSIPAARPPKRARERSPAVPRRPQRKVPAAPQRASLSTIEHRLQAASVQMAAAQAVAKMPSLEAAVVAMQLASHAGTLASWQC
jgi:hypothetical protein